MGIIIIIIIIITIIFFCAWVSNQRPARWYYADRGDFVNYIYTTIITQKFRLLSIPLGYLLTCGLRTRCGPLS